MRVDFYGIGFDLPNGWTDVTDDLEEPAPPTLAKPDGVGVIQFTIAKYRSGEIPNATVDVLRSFLTEFCNQQGIDTELINVVPAHVACVGVASNLGERFLAAWYLSNGRDFAFVTYVGPRVGNAEEYRDASHLVASISF
jgi:hypothetical protein